ncbi:MAG TPA: DUF4118 domain-containing protein, partial [Pseudonocardiaceae bacterium]|nr:DUF4118 domain-containing protein [Pseudonocardiaceae bacterium]
YFIPPLYDFAVADPDNVVALVAFLLVAGAASSVVGVAARRREAKALATANAKSREEFRRLADEQAALRRVATLVARGVPPDDVFPAVAEEVRHILRARRPTRAGDPDRPVTGDLSAAIEELRELARGIHPAILSEGGLGPTLRTLARRAVIPAELDIRTQSRAADPIEMAAYYVVSEALTNTTKHARASCAQVAVEQRDGLLDLSIRDDGIGRADPARGSALIGLRDPLITGSPGRSFSDAPSQDSVTLIPWRSITVSARRALVLATVSGLLLTGTDVQRWP